MQDPTSQPVASVRFQLKYRTSFGQAVKVLGSHPRLGSWNLANAAEMRWTAGDVWVADVKLPAGAVYEYKYVLIDFSTKKAIEWQSGSNAVLAVLVSDTEVSVIDNWGNAPGAMIQVANTSTTREGKLQKWSTEMMGYWKEARQLEMELAQRNTEMHGMKNELAALRMELSMERQARQAAEAHLMGLQVENANLQNQLVAKTKELNSTLSEVLQLLDNEVGDDSDGDDLLDDEALLAFGDDDGMGMELGALGDEDPEPHARNPPQHGGGGGEPWRVAVGASSNGVRSGW